MESWSNPFNSVACVAVYTRVTLTFRAPVFPASAKMS